MKNKTFILTSLSILAVVFCLTFISAVDTTAPIFTTIPSNATIDYGVNWAGVDFDATDETAFDSFSIDDTTHFTIDSNGFLDNKVTLPVGTYTVNVTINDTSDNINWTLYKLQVLALEEAETCEYPDNGNLELNIKDVLVDKGYGKDTEWLPLDEVNVEVQVRNNGNEKINNIVIKWGLYNLDTNEWVIDDKENDFNLKDGDKNTLTISFKLNDPRDFEDEDNYVFYAWATGEDKEFDDEDTCSMDSESIDIIIESDFVIIDDLIVLETASCGSEVQFLADVWNIGEDDQDEVSVLIYNQEMGLNKQVDIGDINAFDSEPLDFTFELPKNLDEKTYTIKLTVYDEDNKVYQNDYDDDKSIKDIFLKVEGGCAVAEASVSAVLESGGEAGRPLVVKATIVNTGDKATTYLLNAAGYAEWASMASLDKTLLTLDAGKSQEVFITFNVNKESFGEKLFVLEVLSENELVLSQPVSVEIIKKGGLFGITGNAFSGDSKYLWGIGILNVILIILIIIIAIRIARK